MSIKKLIAILLGCFIAVAVLIPVFCNLATNALRPVANDVVLGQLSPSNEALNGMIIYNYAFGVVIALLVVAVVFVAVKSIISYVKTNSKEPS